MVKLNKIVRAFTYEGARAKRFTPEMELKRALMNCLLWEDQLRGRCCDCRPHQGAGAAGRSRPGRRTRH
jgi:hypothetical protein